MNRSENTRCIVFEQEVRIAHLKILEALPRPLSPDFWNRLTVQKPEVAEQITRAETKLDAFAEEFIAGKVKQERKGRNYVAPLAKLRAHVAIYERAWLAAAPEIR